MFSFPYKVSFYISIMPTLLLALLANYRYMVLKFYIHVYIYIMYVYLSTHIYINIKIGSWKCLFPQSCKVKTVSWNGIRPFGKRIFLVQLLTWITRNLSGLFFVGDDFWDIIFILFLLHFGGQERVS